MWKQLGEQGTALTGYPVHSVHEDFTWDKADVMSGAADDWAYEHFGVFSWTTEFWDAVFAATGTKQSSDFWYFGPTDAQALAVLRWVDEHAPDQFVDWYPFEHPQLGPVELGGWHYLGIWSNPPPALLRAEVAPHAAFAVAQALASPCLRVRHHGVVDLGGGSWRVEVGIANTGWLPTYVSARAKKLNLVLPLVAELVGDGATVVGGPARLQLGQLEGASASRFTWPNDASQDRVLASWTVQAEPGTTVMVTVNHERAGRLEVELTLPA